MEFAQESLPPVQIPLFLQLSMTAILDAVGDVRRSVPWGDTVGQLIRQ